MKILDLQSNEGPSLENYVARSIETGEFELSSGKESRYYIDKYKFLTNPRALGLIGEKMAEIIDDVQGVEIDKIVGIATGGVPIASVVSTKTDIPFSVFRAQDENFEIDGEIGTREHVVVVDDVLTTGKTVGHALPRIQSKDCVVELVLVVADRSSKEMSFKYETLVHVQNILPDVVDYTSCPKCGEPIRDVTALTVIMPIGKAQPCGCEVNIEEVRENETR